MDTFVTVFGSARILGAEDILCALLMSFVLCFVLASAYRLTFRGFSYSRSFVHTLILSGMIVSMMILAIGNNLARGLGILGTLALVRFRTQVRDPRDMVFLFCCLAVGVACGAATYTVAIVGTLTISAAALLLHWSPFASRREYEGLLRFMLPPKTAAEEDVKAVLRQFCSAFYLVAVREAAQGDLIEHAYQVRLLDPSYQRELVDKLHEIEDVVDANLLMHRITVEL